MRTHYDTLQVGENASQEVIRAAYKVLAQKWHPDKNTHQREFAEEVFKAISMAYDVLSDHNLRTQYDEQLKSQRARPEQPKPEPETDIKNGNYFNDPTTCRGVGGSSNSTPTEDSSKKSNGISRIWNGEVSLGKAFWLYGVIGSHVIYWLGFILFFSLGHSGGDGVDDFDRGARGGWLISIPYFVFISTAIWRSAGKGGIRFWGWIARALCVAPIFVSIIGILAAIAIPSFNDHKNQSQASGPILSSQHVAREPANPATSPAPIAINKSTYTTKPSQDNSPSSPTYAERKEHFRRIYSAHPDAKAIVGSDDFMAWVAKDENRGRIFNNGTTDEIIRLLWEYKARSPEEKLESVIQRSYQRYPFLDIRGPQANQQAIDEVVKLRDYYMSRGWTAHDGLERAVSEIAPKYQHAQSPAQTQQSATQYQHTQSPAPTQQSAPQYQHAQSPAPTQQSAPQYQHAQSPAPTKKSAPQYQTPPRPQYPDCEYKPVMTDKDMRACGLNR